MTELPPAPAYPPAPPYPPPPYPPSAYPGGNPYATPQQWWAPPAPPAPPVLDQQVRDSLHLGGRWALVAGVQPFIPIAMMLLTLVVVVASGLPMGDTAGAAYTLVGGVLAGGVIWLVARSLAARYGGWRAAFGFDLPTWRDTLRVLGWFCLQMGVRIGFLIVLASISPSLADGHGGNTQGVSELQTTALVLAFVGSVVVAPVTEELAFRGILLRGLMRRYRFWPAALLCSAVFASLHVFGAASLAAVPLLLAMTFVFGLLQCVLVRRSGRLGPAIGVHAAMNLLVMVLAASGA